MDERSRGPSQADGLDDASNGHDELEAMVAALDGETDVDELLHAGDVGAQADASNIHNKHPSDWKRTLLGSVGSNFGYACMGCIIPCCTAVALRLDTLDQADESFECCQESICVQSGWTVHKMCAQTPASPQCLACLEGFVCCPCSVVAVRETARRHAHIPHNNFDLGVLNKCGGYHQDRHLDHTERVFGGLAGLVYCWCTPCIFAQVATEIDPTVGRRKRPASAVSSETDESVSNASSGSLTSEDFRHLARSRTMRFKTRVHPASSGTWLDVHGHQAERRHEDKPLNAWGSLRHKTRLQRQDWTEEDDDENWVLDTISFNSEDEDMPSVAQALHRHHLPFRLPPKAFRAQRFEDAQERRQHGEELQSILSRWRRHPHAVSERQMHGGGGRLIGRSRRDGEANDLRLTYGRDTDVRGLLARSPDSMSNPSYRGAGSSEDEDDDVVAILRDATQRGRRMERQQSLENTTASADLANLRMTKNHKKGIRGALGSADILSDYAEDDAVDNNLIRPLPRAVVQHRRPPEARSVIDTQPRAVANSATKLNDSDDEGLGVPASDIGIVDDFFQD